MYIMITALMVLVCAVVVLGWVLVGIALVASLLAGIALVASLLADADRSRDSRSGSFHDTGSPAGRWHASDKKFLREVGIRL
jgi:ABC-type nickel/cobalt efflux system permease component RcnA